MPRSAALFFSIGEKFGLTACAGKPRCRNESRSSLRSAAVPLSLAKTISDNPSPLAHCHRETHRTKSILLRPVVDHRLIPTLTQIRHPALFFVAFNHRGILVDGGLFGLFLSAPL